MLGYSGSGKTRTISSLTKNFAATGNRIGTLKHIHNETFAIDKRGKDTWKYRKWGSSIVIAISPSVFSVMKKRRKGKSRIEEDLDRALQIFRANKTDYLFVEGFNNILEKRQVKAIICSSDIAEAQTLLGIHRNAVCIVATASGNIQPRTSFVRNVPVLKLPKDSQRIVQLIS